MDESQMTSGDLTNQFSGDLTWNSSNIFDEVHEGEEEQGPTSPMSLPTPLLLTFTMLLISILIVGVSGNTLVLIVLIKSQLQSRRSVMISQNSSTTNAYILNLSAADLLFLVFCAPFHGTVYILNHWPFGWFMCKMAHYCQFCTVYASVWILTTMSIDRYLAIGHPLKSVKWRHPKHATRISLVWWLLAAVVSIPWLILYEVDEYSFQREDGSNDTRVACFDDWSDSTYHYRRWLILFGFLVGFLVPSLIIFCMAVLIAKSIRTAAKQPLFSTTDRTEIVKMQALRTQSLMSIGVGGGSGNSAPQGRLKRRRRVGWLVFALSSVFFLCHLPHNTTSIWLNFDPRSIDWITRHYQVFFIMKLLGHMMTYLNSSVNPLLYTMGGSNRFFARLARTCACCARILGTPNGTTMMNGSASCRTFANRTLHAESVLVQFPVSRSNSLVVLSSGNTSTTTAVGTIVGGSGGDSTTNGLQHQTKSKVITIGANGNNSMIRRAPIIPSPTRTSGRMRAPRLAMDRKSSSVLVLIPNAKKIESKTTIENKPISRRLEEIKRMHGAEINKGRPLGTIGENS